MTNSSNEHVGVADLRLRRARVVAFYLPQFHQIPENDRWWGEGFTEWTNVKAAKPLYPGHSQPRIPTSLGYYNLLDSDVRVAQANLAHEYGIEAFCYWHYWFGNGKRLLERPFQEVLESGKPDFPFCLCWANESWTGIWHGAPKHILVEQTYPGEQDSKRHFETLLPAFLDKRYFKIEGKPLFAVYKPEKLPNAEEFVGNWQRMAREVGLPGLFLVAMSNSPQASYLKPFDAVVNHGPGDFLERAKTRQFFSRFLRYIFRGRIAEFFPLKLKSYVRRPLRFSFNEVVENVLPDMGNGERFLPCVLAGWDNTPRSGYRGVVFEGFSPELFRHCLRKAFRRVENNPLERRLVFIKAWNEWAEGNYLEPDTLYKYNLLEEIRKEVF